MVITCGKSGVWKPLQLFSIRNVLSRAEASRESSAATVNNSIDCSANSEDKISDLNENKTGSFPPPPVGLSIRGGQILIGHRVLLQSHPSRCFSLAGFIALFVLDCSSIRWRSKAWRWAGCCEGEERGEMIFLLALGPKGSGANEEGAQSHVLLVVTTQS